MVSANLCIEEAKTVRVLVTGGAGHIGSCLVPKLLQAGHRVRVLDSLMFGGESLLGVYGDPGFELVRKDIRGPDVLRTILDCSLYFLLELESKSCMHIATQKR